MSKMSDLHANTAADRADDAEREVRRLRLANAELIGTLEGIERAMRCGGTFPVKGLTWQHVRDVLGKHGGDRP